MEDSAHWVVHGLLGSYAALLTWLGKGVYNDVKTLKENSKECDLKLADFKLEVSQNYSKETSTQTSLGRIHDRMDTLADKDAVKDLSNEVTEIRMDIKSILRAVGGNGRT